MKNFILVIAPWTLVIANNSSAQMPALPRLQNVELHSIAAPSADSDIWIYQYQLRNGFPSLTISGFSVDVRSDSSRQLDNEAGLEFQVPHHEPTSADNVSRLGKDHVTAVAASQAPTHWSAVIDSKGALSFSIDADEALIGAATTAQFALRSRGLPTIREAVATAALPDELPNFDEIEVTLEEYREALEQTNFKTAVVAPLPPPVNFEPLSFLQEVEQLRTQAEELNWLAAGTALAQLDQRLVQLRSALESGALGAARQLGNQAAEHIEANSCPAFECPGRPFTAEARTVLAINLRYLTSRLVSNEAP